MTTNTFSSGLLHTSDANFRIWWSDFRAALTAIGMVQTSDTGQVNPVTMVRPGINATAGYEIWRFADSLQATAPIFIRFEPGTGASAAMHAIWATIGTSTNGAGVIGGIATARNLISVGSTVGASAYPSYFCHTEGFLGIVFKFNGTPLSDPRPGGGLVICRTCDSAGTPTADGAVTYYTTTAAPRCQTLRFAATAAALTMNLAGYFTCIPHGLDPSAVGSDNQVYQHLMPLPRVVPVFGMLTYMTAEYASGSTVSVAMVGATPRTFICAERSFGFGHSAATPHASIAMLWE